MVLYLINVIENKHENFIKMPQNFCPGTYLLNVKYQIIDGKRIYFGMNGQSVVIIT